MVDTKFLIVTTLCYVGIFIVVLAVCCCAWARYVKNEGRIPANRRTKMSRSRRAARETNIPTAPHCHPQPPPPRQYRYIGDFSELNYQHPTNYTHVQHNCRPHVSRPIYPSANHYTLVEGYPPRNYYPASLATPTDTYDIDLQMDINSTGFADTSHGGFSGDEFSDFQSSRYDSGHDVSAVISGDAAVLSCSDVGNSFKIANNNSVDTDGLTDEFRNSSEALKTDNFESNYPREIDIDGADKLSFENVSDCVVESLLVTSLEGCNGVGITPTCSAQSLTEFNDQQPEQIPLNSH
ncbi:uncharacterized protein LOC110248764 [Exaiptasia diaphana]|uniref:Uncharacterized protein n=1 Tax=Exaiptasia diaphana TaxID=2652724 RepID=A0A913XWL1_EXADI|nr:uncharacterized protein LOC110248764 [Exaiptasia diaphana]